MSSSRFLTLTAVLLTALSGWMSCSENQQMVRLSWVVFIFLTIVLVASQRKERYSMILSIVSAYFLFIGGRFTAGMLQVVLSEESTGLRIFAGFVSLLGFALIIVAFQGHFRQRKAIRIFFWTSVFFALGAVVNVITFATGDGYSSATMALSQLGVWIAIIAFSHFLNKHPEKLEMSQDAQPSQGWLW
jgi:hypothetical protein